MSARLIFGLCAALAISGCASYPRLVVTQAVPPVNPASKSEIDTILADAAWLQQSYADGYKKTARIADFGQLPLIGAAAAAAWILLDNKTNASTVVGKIGIGAGSYAAARGQLSAAGLPEAYIAGHGALTCVLSEGSTFAGTGAAQRYAALDAALQALADQVALVQLQIIDIPTGTPSADETAMLTAARSLAQQAITQANTTQQASLAQQGAYLESARVFRNAVSAISVRVASRGRVRPALDYGTLRDSFGAPPKTPQIVGNGQSGSNASSVIQTLTGGTSELLRQSALLTSSTPRYAESLARVTACPALAG